MNRFIYSCILWIEPCFLDNSHFTFFFPSFFYASFALLQRYEFRLTWKHRRLMGEEEKRMRVSITTCRFRQENKVSSKSTFTTYYAHCIRFQFFFFSIKNANPIYRIYRTCQLKMEIDLRRRKIFLRLSSLRESSILEKDFWWFFSTPSTRIREGCQDWNFQSTLFSFHRLTKPFNVGAYFTRQSSSWKKKKVEIASHGIARG